MRVKYTFEQVKRRTVVKTYCNTCQKKRSRTLHASQTINPFNTDAEGNMKTRDTIVREIAQELFAAKTELEEKGLVCNNCQKEAQQ